MLRSIAITQAVLLTSGLPIQELPKVTSDATTLAHVGALVLPYDASCTQGEGFLFSAGDVSCMASPFEAMKYCSDESDGEPCLRNGPGGTSSMKYMKVDSQSSREQMMSVTAEAEGGGWGVKVSASVASQQSSKMSSESTSYVLYGHKHLGNLEVANAQNLKLTQQAKDLMKQGFEAFTNTYGTHLVGYISSGATFYGSYTLYSESSSSEDKLSVEASVSGSYGPFSAEASASFDQSLNSASSKTKVEATLRCTGTVECASEPPTSAEKMLEMSKTWHSSTDKVGTPLKMAIYPFGRSADMANSLHSDLAKDWTLEQKQAILGFGTPTAPMIQEWKVQQGEAKLFLNAIVTALDTWDGMNQRNIIERATKRPEGLVSGKSWKEIGKSDKEPPKGYKFVGQDVQCLMLGERLFRFPAEHNNMDEKGDHDYKSCFQTISPEDGDNVYIKAPKCVVDDSRDVAKRGDECYWRSTKTACEADNSVCMWRDDVEYYAPAESVVGLASTNRRIGRIPVQCQCPNGRQYNVGDYTMINSCEKDKSDWKFEWWTMGGAAACAGGVIHWPEAQDQICDKSQEETRTGRVSLAEATMGVTCSVPEVQIQLQNLLEDATDYHALFLDTSLDNVLNVQRKWQTDRKEVFFWRGSKLQDLKNRLDAIARVMDSSLVLLEGYELPKEKKISAAKDNESPCYNKQIKDAKLHELQLLVGEQRLSTPQACAVAVLENSMTNNEGELPKCSDQYMMYEQPKGESTGKCFCMPPATRCERETKTANITTADGGAYLSSDALGDRVKKQDNYLFKITKNLNSKDEKKLK